MNYKKGSAKHLTNRLNKITKNLQKQFVRPNIFWYFTHYGQVIQNHFYFLLSACFMGMRGRQRIIKHRRML